jgi:predicted carbohydrate-binding protein with CBM5 and CBM33 domain
MKGLMRPWVVTHCLLLALVAAAVLESADAHGWIKQPASRSLMAVGEDNFYQQMSLNRCVVAPHPRTTNSRTRLVGSVSPCRHDSVSKNAT